MNRIKDLRTENTMTQKNLADLLSVSSATVSSWEVGRTEPDFASLRQMSEFFNVSIDYILGGDKKERPTIQEDGERFLMDVSALSPENRDRVEEYMRLLLLDQEHGQS